MRGKRPQVKKRKKKKKKKSPPEKRIRASDIIEVFRLVVPQHVEKASWAANEGFFFRDED